MSVTIISALAAATAAPTPSCNMTGAWKDTMQNPVFVALEGGDGALTVDMSSVGLGHPTGAVNANGTMTLNFVRPLTHSTGILGANCTLLTWTDKANAKLHHKWCRVGSHACSAPPAPPPHPSPTPPTPPTQMYPGLWGGAFTGAASPSSPDPLAGYRWNASAIASEALQQYTSTPTKFLSQPDPRTFINADSLLRGNSNSSSSSSMMRVHGYGTIAADFGTECAGWLEFDSPDLAAAKGSVSVSMSTSEYNQPQFTTPTGGNNGGNCTGEATPISNTGGKRFRLVLNSELYEGLRYGWIHVQPLHGSSNHGLHHTDGSSDDTDTAPSFSIANWTAVCQVLPVNYYDHAFETDGGTVPAGSPPGAGAVSFAEVWHTALYTTRVDILAPPALLGSILMDRGDRISWTGDAHLAQKAVLAGIGGDHGSSIVLRNLLRTKTGDNGIITYDMYWILSLVDYFMHAGDEATLAACAPIVISKFQVALAFWKVPRRQNFCGSDERIGADFNQLPTASPEMTRYYKMLSVQAAQEYAAAVAMCSDVGCSAAMKQQAANIGSTTAALFASERKSSVAWTDYGMHSAAGAIGTGLLTADEEASLFVKVLNNPTHLCSFAPFNTYFVLFGLGRIRLNSTARTAGPDSSMAAMQRALGMIRRCFHGMNRLGATTYWETFSAEWNNLFEYGDPTPNSQTGYMSHCHPWASGAAPWLTHNLLGIAAITPNFKTFRATPFLDPTSPNFLSSITGVQGLPGDRIIAARFSCNGSSWLDIPANTSASVVALPLCGSDPTTVTVNGVSAKLGAVMPERDAVLLAVNPLVGPAKYVFKLGFQKSSVLAPQVALGSSKYTDNDSAGGAYRDRFVAADAATAGDWVGKYGARGYYLKSFEKAGVDVSGGVAQFSGPALSFGSTGSSLPHTQPNYMSPLSCNSSQTDRRGLQVPPTNTSALNVNDADPHEAVPLCRGLGAVVGATTGSITILNSSYAPSGVKRNISIYFVDYERSGRRLAVECREYENLQLATPTQFIGTGMEKGVYLTWEVELPIVFRLMQVSGPLPNNDEGVSLSAIFFD